MFEKSLALFFSLMILGQAYVVRRVVGTWLFPACIFALFWFCFTFFPLAVLFWVPVHPYAVGLIFLSTMAFSLGSVPFGWRTAFAKNAGKQETAAVVYRSPFLRWVFYLSSFTASLFVILDSLAQGISLHDMFFDLVASATTYINMASFDGLEITLFARFAPIFAYLASITGGFLFPCTPSRTERRFIVVLSFLAPVLIAVTQSSKFNVFLCIVFFYAGLLVHRVWTGKLYLFGKLNIKLVTLGVALLMAVTIVSFLSRGLSGVEDEDFVEHRLVSSFISYSCAQLYAFSDWFSFTLGGHSEISYPREADTLGFYTFTPVLQFMGNRKTLPPGIFDEYYSYGDLISGNVYTMFRGLITDFGFVGSVLVMFTVGLLLHGAFYAMLGNDRPVLAVGAFVFGVGYSYVSVFVSMLVWGRIYVAFVLLWVILRVNKEILERSDRRLVLPRTGDEAAALP